MSRKLTVILFTMLALVGAMGLKTALTARDNGVVLLATGNPAPTPW
jgi:hypothetical protein